jgi:hypothetical protein
MRAGACACRSRFQIPMQALQPREPLNFLLAGKILGVTHLTNGAFRLHPVEWATGEASGMIASLWLERGGMPTAAEVQAELARSGVPMVWFDDLGLRASGVRVHSTDRVTRDLSNGCAESARRTRRASYARRSCSVAGGIFRKAAQRKRGRRSCGAAGRDGHGSSQLVPTGGKTKCRGGCRRSIRIARSGPAAVGRETLRHCKAVLIEIRPSD